MIDLNYSLILEATEEPSFIGFDSPHVEGFAGLGHSAEDCLYQARCGMEKHLELLREQVFLVPKSNPNPKNHDPKARLAR